MAIKTEQPPSPVANLTAWRDPELEDTVRDRIRARSYDEDALADLLNRITMADVEAAAGMAELGDIEAAWSSEERDWYQWGLREIHAEERAIKAYRAVLQAGRAILGGQLKELRRKATEARVAADAERKKEKDAERARAHEERQDRAARAREAFAFDEEFVRARRDVMYHAHRVLAARKPGASGLTLDQSLNDLEASVNRYDSRREELRAEHGQVEPYPHGDD